MKTNNVPDQSGKYDDLCEATLMATGAKAALLIILDGPKGSGFSVTTTSLLILQGIPKLLRDVADSIEKQSTLN